MHKTRLERYMMHPAQHGNFNVDGAPFLIIVRSLDKIDDFACIEFVSLDISGLEDFCKVAMTKTFVVQFICSH